MANQFEQKVKKQTQVDYSEAGKRIRNEIIMTDDPSENQAKIEKYLGIESKFKSKVRDKLVPEVHSAYMNELPEGEKIEYSVKLVGVPKVRRFVAVRISFVNKKGTRVSYERFRDPKTGRFVSRR